MVCNRCKMVVKSTLEANNIHTLQVDLGEVILKEDLSQSQRQKLNTKLQALGFELLNSRNSQNIEKVKNLITDLVQNKLNSLHLTLSDYISAQLKQDYAGISRLFSEVEGITIEQYYILQKVEKIKELLVYDELSISEIAIQLNYSSVAYLSNQFKKVTGMSPSQFKGLAVKERRPLDEL